MVCYLSHLVYGALSQQHELTKTQRKPLLLPNCFTGAVFCCIALSACLSPRLNFPGLVLQDDICSATSTRPGVQQEL